MMSDPFKLMIRLTVMLFKVAGYFIACLLQSLWYVAHGKNELVGDAIGFFGRDVTNAISEVFSQR